MKVDPRSWRLTGGIWGIVGVAALAVVMALAVMMIPRAEVAAKVNGESILVEDVEELQVRYGMSIDYEQALEHLITEMILFQEAEKGGYLPTRKDAESELHTQLAMMGLTKEDFDEQLKAHTISYQTYLEGFRREMAIHDYLDAAVEVPDVTEEEAREFYDDYAQQHPDEELPSFEDAKSSIIQMLERERQQDAQAAIQLLIEDLREESTIEYG